MLIAVISVFVTACSNDDDEVSGICEISGIVSDSEGNPIEGASVIAYAVDAVCTPPEAVANQDGHYILTLQEATTSILIRAEADGFNSDDKVLTDIPYQGGCPGVTLGSAKITVDIVMTRE